MTVAIPTPQLIAEVLAGGHAPDDLQLSEALHRPKLLTRLNRWSLWLLICLSRHTARQKWVGYIVESRLGGNLRQIGKMGALGHPEACAQRGKVPGLPEWRYFFHGCGCCLTNEVDGARIDVDFDDAGRSTRIDPYFYTGFLDSLKNPELPESTLKRPSPLHNYWHEDLADLETLGCWKDNQVAPLGMQLSHALEPVVECLSRMHGGIEHVRQSVYLNLQLGDCIHAEEISKPESLPEKLIQEITSAAQKVKTSRAATLSPIVRTATRRYGVPLQTLAELGPEFSKTETIECLFHSPVDGAANAALSILELWQQADLDSILEELIEFRAGETDSSAVPRFFRWRKKRSGSGDPAPRDSQLTSVARLILVRQGKAMNPMTRALLLKVLKGIRTARQGEAALMLYLLDEKAGLQALNQALTSKIPIANNDATAACVLIGTDATKTLLVKSLGRGRLDQQHAAACGLSRFPSSSEVPELTNWMRAHDGISDPVGKDTKIGDRTFRMYSMSDVAHRYMQGHIDRAIESFGDLVPLIKDA